MKKCELCDCMTKKTIKIKNKHNGNELEICRGCAVRYGFVETQARNRLDADPRTIPPRKE